MGSGIINSFLLGVKKYYSGKKGFLLRPSSERYYFVIKTITITNIKKIKKLGSVSINFTPVQSEICSLKRGITADLVIPQTEVIEENASSPTFLSEF